MKEILLHSCCAPCSSAILEWMLQNDVRPTIFYSNSNIYPREEYAIRREEIVRYAKKLGVTLIEDEYDHEKWRAWVLNEDQTMANEPERGRRCLRCFQYRLQRAAEKARELGLPELTTTLASSRWKSLDQINEAGKWACEMANNKASEDANNAACEVETTETTGTTHGETFCTAQKVSFNETNWRKGGLQQRRNELLKEEGFYNQLYCGCEFSIRDTKPTEKARD